MTEASKGEAKSRNSSTNKQVKLYKVQCLQNLRHPERRFSGSELQLSLSWLWGGFADKLVCTSDAVSNTAKFDSPSNVLTKTGIKSLKSLLFYAKYHNKRFLYPAGYFLYLPRTDLRNIPFGCNFNVPLSFAKFDYENFVVPFYVISTLFCWTVSVNIELRISIEELTRHFRIDQEDVPSACRRHYYLPAGAITRPAQQRWNLILRVTKQPIKLKGDSGGPLVCKNTGDPRERDKGILVGVVAGKLGVGTARQGTVFTRVSSYRAFISSASSFKQSPLFVDEIRCSLRSRLANMIPLLNRLRNVHRLSPVEFKASSLLKLGTGGHFSRVQM
ncbi:trypsin domain-containing protein [Phthorimaea operculella]|nr:trypsin domain-containing protein [Phthorimaea operculella]